MRYWIMVACAPGLAMAAHAGAVAGSPPYAQEDCDRFTVQMDLNRCANNNLDAANAALNRIYRQAMAALTDQKSKDRLRTEERAWIASRDKTCNDDVGPQEDGGSIWPMEMANCQQDQTDARIRVLQKMLK